MEESRKHTSQEESECLLYFRLWANHGALLFLLLPQPCFTVQLKGFALICIDIPWLKHGTWYVSSTIKFSVSKLLRLGCSKINAFWNAMTFQVSITHLLFGSFSRYVIYIVQVNCKVTTACMHFKYISEVNSSLV